MIECIDGSSKAGDSGETLAIGPATQWSPP